MSGTEQGYIKLHRKLLDNPICQRLDYLQLWVILLLKANHKETELLWDGGVIKLKAGQLVTGRKSLSKASGINEYKVERILKYLKNTQQIAQQTHNKFRIITIVNWERYQGDEREMHNKMHNNCTTDAQQLHTDKNDKNVKNDKKESSRNFVAPSLQDVQSYCLERKNSVNAENFVDFYESKGWLVGKNKMKDWRAAVRTWEGRDKQNPQKVSEKVIVPNYAKGWIKQ